MTLAAPVSPSDTGGLPAVALPPPPVRREPAAPPSGAVAELRSLVEQTWPFYVQDPARTLDVIERRREALLKALEALEAEQRRPGVLARLATRFSRVHR